jgi:hypothetical protein
MFECLYVSGRCAHGHPDNESVAYFERLVFACSYRDAGEDECSEALVVSELVAVGR